MTRTRTSVRWRSSVGAAWVLPLVFQAGVLAQPCVEPFPLDPQPPLGGTVNALAMFDEDGAGGAPARLFAGGMLRVHGEPHYRVARYDGAGWTALPSPGVGGAPHAHDPEVMALAVFDAGAGERLYAGIAYGGTPLWVWDGAAWAAVPVGNPVSSIYIVPALGVDPVTSTLHVSGYWIDKHEYEHWEGHRFDGSAWIEQPAPSQFVAVDHDGAGPQAPVFYAPWSSHIRRFDGSDWIPVTGSPYYSRVFRLAAHRPGGQEGEVLVAAVRLGLPTRLGFVAWNGEELYELADPFPGATSASAMTSYDPDGPGPLDALLVVSGSFRIGGGAPGDRLAAWNGTTWSQLAGGLYPFVYGARAMIEAPLGPPHAARTLVIGGKFDRIGRFATQGFGMYDDGVLRGVSEGLNDVVFATERFGPPGEAQLHVAGQFTRAGDVALHRVAHWDGHRWHSLGAGLPPTQWRPHPIVHAMKVHDDGTGAALYVGGALTKAGEQIVHNIARWNGQAWLPVGVAGLHGGAVRALESHDPDGAGPLPPVLYAGGAFATADGAPAPGLAVWDGAGWSAAHGGISGGPVRALRSWDDGSGPALWVGGDPMVPAGAPAPGGPNIVWKVDGQEWTELPKPVSGEGRVYALCIHDHGEGQRLHAAGEMGVTNNVLGVLFRLDGQEWTTIRQGSRIFACRSIGRGHQASLYIGTQTSANVLQGGEWKQVARHTYLPTFAISEAFRTPGGARVYLGGNFDTLDGTYFEGGDLVASRIVSAPVCEGCYANCDGSTTPPLVNVDDLTCFIGEFTAAMSLPHTQQVLHYANCNGSTSVPALTIDDFNCFMGKVAAGCP